MHRLLLVLLATLSSLGGAGTQHVVDLTHTTFDSVASEAPVLVEFYAHWCGHCRSFAPAYAEVARILRESSTEDGAQSNIVVARVDADESRVLLQRFGVRALPTLFYVSGKRAIQYDGQLSTEGVLAFVKSRGTKHGTPLRRTLGPFHPYWRLVSAFVVRAERLHAWILAEPGNMGIAGLAFAASALGAVVLFTGFVHVLTKPAPARSRTRQSHAHAE